jgi:hypothetical protein
MTKKRTSRVQASLLLWLLLLPASSAGVLPSLLASDTPSGSLLGAGCVYADRLADVCVSVLRSVFVSLSLSLSLSPYLSLSFQRSIAKPGTASSASTSSSSGCTRRCYFYPSRDASVSAICPRFLFLGAFLFLRRSG